MPIPLGEPMLVLSPKLLVLSIKANGYVNGYYLFAPAFVWITLS